MYHVCFCSPWILQVLIQYMHRVNLANICLCCALYKTYGPVPASCWINFVTDWTFALTLTQCNMMHSYKNMKQLDKLQLSDSFWTGQSVSWQPALCLELIWEACSWRIIKWTRLRQKAASVLTWSNQAVLGFCFATRPRNNGVFMNESRVLLPHWSFIGSWTILCWHLVHLVQNSSLLFLWWNSIWNC